jgi:hypothetical protein
LKIYWKNVELIVYIFLAAAYLANLLVLEIPGKEIAICMGGCMLFDQDIS